MVTDQTKANIAAAFRRAVGVSMVRSEGDVCRIVDVQGEGDDEHLASKLVVITISSFVFRLLVVFQVAKDKETRSYYGGDGHGDEQTLNWFSEVANMCCGALSRELSACFANIAMSIPCTVSSRCGAFLCELQPRYMGKFDILVNDSAQVRATCCLFCHTPVDFIPAGGEVSHSGGELELF